VRLLNRSAGRLSRHRRGPVAGLLVILLGLLLTGGLYYAVFSPAQAEEEALSQQQKIDAGRELFLVSCSFCHGQNGEGVLAADGKSQLGPSLVGVGEAAVEFQVETGRMPAVQPGQQLEAKADVFNREETEALMAYVGSLGPGPAAPEEADYSIEGLSEDEQRAAIMEGGNLFLANCSACHNFEGSGGAMPWGKYAPKLKGVEDKHLYEAMQTGPQQMPVFSDSVLRPEDKRNIIAYVNSLEENPGYGGFSMGGLGPVAEGAFAWLVGIGGLVGFAYWIAAHTTRSKKEEA
jgi:ubiquinol-cytochrome c reductase cytochrome c subunit